MIEFVRAGFSSRGFGRSADELESDFGMDADEGTAGSPVPSPAFSKGAPAYGIATNTRLVLGSEKGDSYRLITLMFVIPARMKGERMCHMSF